MASIFTRILNNDIPGHVVFESEDFFALLDKFPARYGHTLVVPKQETDYIFDLDDETYHNLWSFASTVARAVEAETGAKKVGVKVEGLEIRHVHVHLIPLDTAADFTGSVSVSEEEQTRMREALHARLSGDK